MTPLRIALVAGVLVMSAVSGCASVQAIHDAQFGLGKGSVFDTATPVPYSFEGGDAGRTIAPLPGSGMPPMISHAVDDYLPITAAGNDCLTCHGKPELIGRARAKGQPTPAPASHYRKDAGGQPTLAGMNYNCMTCHAPQAGVRPLVDNRSR